MTDLPWYLAAIGWALWLTQIGWTANVSRRLHESHMREDEYCAMLDRLRGELRKKKDKCALCGGGHHTASCTFRGYTGDGGGMNFDGAPRRPHPSAKDTP